LIGFFLLCFYHSSAGKLFIFAFIIIVLGVNGPLQKIQMPTDAPEGKAMH